MNTMKNAISLIICGMFLCMTGCENPTPVVRKYTRVEKVISPGKYWKYSILAVDPETKEVILQDWAAPKVDIKVFADLSSEESIWVKEEKTEVWYIGPCYTVEIHIHSAKEIVSR